MNLNLKSSMITLFTDVYGCLTDCMRVSNCRLNINTKQLELVSLFFFRVKKMMHFHISALYTYHLTVFRYITAIIDMASLKFQEIVSSPVPIFAHQFVSVA